MNSGNPSTDRDLFAEVDEIIRTMRTVLDAVANMGKEVIHHREQWHHTVTELSAATEALKGNFGKQTELNELLQAATTESLNAVSAFLKRISSIEDDGIKPLTNAVYALEERLDGQGRLYAETTENFTLALKMLGDSFKKQEELNLLSARNEAEHLRVLTTFHERLSALENGYHLIG